MTVGDYRVYLWLYSWMDGGDCLCELWKIGCTGMPSMESRIVAWGGWLGMTSAMTRALTEMRGAWVVNRVAVSDSFGTSKAARDYEKSLHDKYAGNGVGHELFTAHPDFGPEFFGHRGSPDSSTPLLDHHS